VGSEWSKTRKRYLQGVTQLAAVIGAFTFRGRNGKYRLIDDFLASDTPSIWRVTEENGTLVYSTAEGERVLARPLASEE
jgi:hypothetical protein